MKCEQATLDLGNISTLSDLLKPNSSFENRYLNQVLGSDCQIPTFITYNYDRKTYFTLAIQLYMRYYRNKMNKQVT